MELIVVADIDSYLHVWQWVPVGVFVVAWLLVGGWLFRRELLKVSDVPQRRVKFGRGLLASFTTGLAAIFVGLLIGLLFYRMGLRFEMPALDYVGAVAGVVMALVAAYVIGYVVLGFSAKQTFHVVWRPVVAVFAMAAIVTAACAPATISQTKADEGRKACGRNMTAIAYSLRRTRETPRNLQALVSGRQLHDEQIRCPASKKEYFYMPVKRTGKLDKMLDKMLNKTLVVCDLAENHPGGRLVIFANWSCEWKTDSEFDELLKLPVNEAFAKELGGR
jgi:vacuolar-type H+-ATPase subunit I/STV1